jgi:hypothetical protein
MTPATSQTPVPLCTCAGKAIHVHFQAVEGDLIEAQNPAKLAQMRVVLGYPLTIFINIDSDETHVGQRPEAIAGQTACYAVRLENGNPVVRIAAPAPGNGGGH